jgi:enterochelin esterase family protein
LVSCNGNNPLVLPTDTPLPPTPTAAPSATPTPAPSTLAGFDSFIQEIENLKPGERQEIVNPFMAQITQAPLTSDTRAVFLWRGAAHTVHVVGDMNNWNLVDASMLTRIEGTDLWYLISEYESDARLEYQVVIDNENWQLDPLNPNSMNSPTGPNSILSMPRYEIPPELLPISTAPQGTIDTHTLDSQSLNQTRTIFIYEPAGQLVGQKLPVVIFNNGSEYLNLINASMILDQLIAQRLVPPMVAVFVPAINAGQDYGLNDAYVKFLADELTPFVQENFDTSLTPESTAILGLADGARAAVHAAVSRPDVFGLVGSQSGTFTADDIAFIREISRLEAGSITTNPSLNYFIVGTYETAIVNDGLQANNLEANRQMAAVLEEAGFGIKLLERPEGHSWSFWQGTLGQILRQLLN